MNEDLINEVERELNFYVAPAHSLHKAVTRLLDELRQQHKVDSEKSTVLG